MESDEVSSKAAGTSASKADSPSTEHRETTGQASNTDSSLSGSKTDTSKRDDETYVGSLDQGTTSTRFLIFNKDGNPVASHQIEFKQYYPKPGWHEHDPEEVISSAQTCIDKAVESFEADGHSRKSIAAIGITNQRETTLVWDKNTGKTLYNAIAWPDTRTSSMVRDFKSKSGSDKLRGICGLPLSTYPSSVKLAWLLKNVDEVKKAYQEGRLAFSTIDTWLLYRLNGGKDKDVFVTDATNASRTMFVDLHTLKYSNESLDFFGIDKNKIALPKIVPSSDPEAFGVLASGALEGVKITGCLGDQSAALVGQCAFEPGMAKNTYGTGCFLLYNVGEKPVMSEHGLLATVAYHFGGERKPVYALEGSIAVAGSGVKFLVNNLGIGEKSEEISELAGTVEDNGGCVFVTAFSGLFAPYWIDDAQGTIFGITQHTTKGHIARATIEATCFQTKAILDAMEKDCGHKLQELAVDGGMTNSDMVMQAQADILSIPVDRPSMRETTSLGAAIAAGFAVGVWKEFSELKNINRDGRQVFKPQIAQAESAAMFKLWSKAVNMCKGWVDAERKEKEEETKEHDEKEEESKNSSNTGSQATSHHGVHGGVTSVAIGKGNTLDKSFDNKDQGDGKQEAQGNSPSKRTPYHPGVHGGVTSVVVGKGNTLPDDFGNKQGDVEKETHKPGVHGGMTSVVVGKGSTLPEDFGNKQGDVENQPYKPGVHGGVESVKTGKGNTLDESLEKKGQGEQKMAGTADD